MMTTPIAPRAPPHRWRWCFDWEVAIARAVAAGSEGVHPPLPLLQPLLTHRHHRRGTVVAGEKSLNDRGWAVSGEGKRLPVL